MPANLPAKLMKPIDKASGARYSESILDAGKLAGGKEAR
jgi:hypothetical protein